MISSRILFFKDGPVNVLFNTTRQGSRKRTEHRYQSDLRCRFLLPIRRTESIYSRAVVDVLNVCFWFVGYKI